jgi:histone H3/H4
MINDLNLEEASEQENEEDLENEEEDGIPRVSRKGTLSKFLKYRVPGRIAGDSRELLMNQLEQITLILTKRASELSRVQGRQTIFVDDLEKAYEELLNPHVFIEKIVQTLENQKDELRTLADSSLIRHMEVE